MFINTAKNRNTVPSQQKVVPIRMYIRDVHIHVAITDQCIVHICACTNVPVECVHLDTIASGRYHQRHLAIC